MNSVASDGGSAGGERSAQSAAASGAQVVSSKSADGKVTLALELPREDVDLVVRFKARPVTYPDRALLVFAAQKRHIKPIMKECEPRIVVDGNLVAAPASTFIYESLFESRSIELRMTELQTLARATRVLADVCGKRVELTGQDLAVVREFLTRFKEELALAGMPTASEQAPPAEQPEGQQSL